MAETDDDAVSILTIHGAKGLEFPITVVSGATTQVGRGRSGPTVHWDGDVPEVRLSKGKATSNFDRLADIEMEMDAYERLRLLYVACTRARDHLVVSTFHKERVTSYGSMLAEAVAASGAPCRSRFGEVGEALSPDEPAPIAAAVPSMPLTLPFDDREGWVAQRDALLAPHRWPRFVSATAIAAELGLDAGASVEEGERDESDERDERDLTGVPGESEGDGEVAMRPELPWRRGRAGTAIGRAVHATLQLLDDPHDDERLVALATQQAHLEAVPDAIDTVAALARSALRAPSVQAAHTAARRWRELYVAAPLGDRAIEGYLDLLYETPAGLVLVDYKTDAVRSAAEANAKTERYAPQTAAYAVAVEVSTGLSVVDARLVFCTSGEPIERAVPDLDAAKQRVRELLLHGA
jgi:ATP-dependent helicase/nuclease subunit A